MEAALLLALFIASVVNGAYYAFSPGQALHIVDRYVSHLPMWLHKPLTGCAPCMCSAWGTAIFALHWTLLGSVSWLWWPFVIFAAVALTMFVFQQLQPKEQPQPEPVEPPTPMELLFRELVKRQWAVGAEQLYYYVGKHPKWIIVKDKPGTAITLFRDKAPVESFYVAVNADVQEIARRIMLIVEPEAKP